DAGCRPRTPPAPSLRQRTCASPSGRVNGTAAAALLPKPEIASARSALKSRTFNRAILPEARRSNGALDQLPRRLELLLGEPDVRVPPQALRKDAGGLDRRRVVQVGNDGDRPNRI